MCFSAEADFTAAVVVGVIGVTTLRKVHTRRELIVGALPMLFAAHQFVEGVVWLGLRGQVSSGLGTAAIDAYVVFAYAILPVLVPVGFLLLEPVRRHRDRILPFTALGAAVGMFFLWRVLLEPIDATAQARGIAYDLHTPDGTGVLLTIAYVVVTCGPALLSSRRYLRWFGLVNLVGAGVAATVHRVEFASVWCLYAALASLLILEHFRRERVLDPWPRRTCVNYG